MVVDSKFWWRQVVDGPLFEARFNALRFKRGKRKEDAMHRPFARMHIHFVLVTHTHPHTTKTL